MAFPKATAASTHISLNRATSESISDALIISTSVPRSIRSPPGWSLPTFDPVGSWGSRPSDHFTVLTDTSLGSSSAIRRGASTTFVTAVAESCVIIKSKQAASIVVGTCARPAIAQARFGLRRTTNASSPLAFMRSRSGCIR